MNVKNNTPEIRLNGFSGDWVEKRLEDVVDIVGGGTPDTTNPEFWDGEIDWYSPTEIGKNVYADKSVKTITKLGFQKSSAQILPAHKTILFTSRAGIGDMAILRSDAATNQGFQSFIAKDIDVYFLYSMGHLLKEYALEKASGSTFLEVSKKQLSVIEILIPSNIEEQATIGHLFKQLDDTITLSKHKYEKTKNLKNAFLSKIFPQAGKNQPDIRLKGFSGDWVEKRLEEVVEIVGGGTPDTTNPEFWDGEIDWYSPTEIGKKVYADKSVKTITDLGLQKSSAQILPAHETILFTSRAGIGDMAILRNEAATNQGFQSFIAKEIDVYFLYSMGHLLKEYALGKASGSTFLEISKKQLSVIEILIPSNIEEQTAIGNFFKQLDDTLALQAKQLKALENLKKALLAKMFV